MLFDPVRRWIPRGTCRSMDPKHFFAKGGPQLGRLPTPETQAHWDKAKEICARCPVLDECRRDTLGEEYGVWGGLDERERHLLRQSLSRRAKKWPPELRREWGEALHGLRGQGLAWGRIRTMTGINSALADQLITEWLEHRGPLPAKPTPKVVDLELPEFTDTKPFPAKEGRKHCWVRHNNGIRDAHYKAQTSDGEWIFVQLRAGRGNSMTWVRREDVRMYHPQPVCIQPYMGRPDRYEQSA